MDMASFVVSPVITRLLDTCASLIQQEHFPLFPSYKDAVEKLSRCLITVQPTVTSAEANRYEEKTLEDWLSRLTEAAYDAEHELDTISTELHLMIGREISQIDSSHIQNLSHRIENIAEEKQRLDLLFTVKSCDSRLQGSLHTDFLGDTAVFGRERERNEIIDLLLCEKAKIVDKNVAVIGINGTGGVGKTTLAHLILNDERVKRFFESDLIWVSLAQGFILPGILDGIRGFPSNITCNESQYSSTEQAFKEFVSGKRFLIILDNLSFMNQSDKVRLLQLLELGMKGSKLLYTSRSPHEIDEETSFLLKPLSMENCWTMFKTIAFKDGKPRSSDFKELGEAIVDKCQGLPLSVKVLASLLQGNADLLDWKRIQESNMWKLDQPALKLCYYNLPSHLKECLLSCSSFPKDYVFNKKELAKIWMAQGFIPMGDKDDAEEIGLKYFEELLRRCLFQPFKIGNDDGMRYIMHDVIYDFVLKNSCFPENRHILEIKSAYTVPTVDELFFQQNASRLKFLRVLDLSWSSIVFLPSYIEECKLLRYLDLSSSSVFGLHGSICNLYNLQTLRLLDCVWLEDLPRNLCKLSKLRHFEIDKPEWRHFFTWPEKLGSLTGLRTLSVYKVGMESGYRIEELSDMENLTGSLNISCLENAVNAKEANLKKKGLGKLVFEWSEKIENEEFKEESYVNVLEDLSPNGNILELGVVNYRSIRFPNWMTDGVVLQNLEVLTLNNSIRFKVLTLELPSLRKLSIKGEEELEEILSLQCPVLNELQMVDCRAICSLPKDGVPASVEFIRIQRCWRLFQRFQKETGPEWPKIAHVGRYQIRKF